MRASRIGPYEVVRELGRGGMGVVLEVRHPELPRRLALKLITPELADAEALERFDREARLLARVRHPNVVVIHAFDRAEDGRPYLVTDLVEGTSLSQVARAKVPPDALRAARLVQRLASAVAALHAGGVLHRDLKPANVILQPDDTPVLLDFGLAREVEAERLTQTGALVGTPAYMAPEQAEGAGALDARTDVYGLGTILFELLAGRPPFELTGPVQLVAAVLGKAPRWPSEDRQGVPPALEAVLRRAMAKAPAARYPSAEALADDLGRFLAGQAVTARAPARGPWRVLGAAALAVTLSLAAAVLMRPAPDTSSPATTRVEPPRTSEPAVAVVATPSWDERRPVSSYRAHLRWLDERADHPARPAVEGVVADQRLRETPLRRVELEGVQRDDVIVRWLSDRELAVLALQSDGTPAVRVLDVDGDRAPVRRWSFSADFIRPRDLALSPAPDARGRRRVLISGRWSVHAGLLGPGAPDATASILSLMDEPPLPGQDLGLLPALAISPDGSRAVVAGDWSYAVWIDLAADPPRELLRAGAFEQAVDAVATSPDGRWIVFGTEGGRAAYVALFTSAGEARGIQHLGVPIRSIAFSPDGRLVVGTSSGPPLHQPAVTDQGLQLTNLPVDVEAAAPLLAFGAASPAILYGICGPARLVPGPMALRVWSLKEPERPVELRRVPLGERHVASIAVSPDGAILALGRDDDRRVGVELWAVGDR